MFRAAQVNFSKGEIAPELYARFDVDAYNAGAKRARNVIVQKYGGLTKRAGTRLVAEVFDATEATMLFPFQFSLEQAYALEFGQGYMRAHALGGNVLNEELFVTGITNAVQAVVSAAFHGYDVGDQVYLSGIAGAMGDFLNGRFWSVVAVNGDGSFTISADTSAVEAFTAATGGITRAVAPAAPPAPPVVPPPYVPPEPPYTGGGSYEPYYFGYGFTP
jgi:hypothetical protein